tara:strand:- start:217 stop:1419 length:1203 start_codon:yes stop_codon:yes gene_type:complete
MQTDQPYLFIDIDDKKIIFSAIRYNETSDYEIISNLIVKSDGIENGKIVNVKKFSTVIKNTLSEMEEKINHLFTKAIIIISPDKINCINVCGYKKLNGSQVSKEDVTYILNDSKKLIILNENRNSLVHLFNSSFSIDSDNLENLPIGLFGEFYNQNMSFFLIEKNTLKNIKSLFNDCGISIERIVLKSFVEGINLLTKKVIDKNFLTIKIQEERSNLSLFKNNCFLYSEEFNFGSNLFLQDLSKICSLKIEEVESVLKDLNLKSFSNRLEHEILDKKYFIHSPYRKIRLKLIYDVVEARLDELFEIFYKKNINLNYYKKSNKALYIYVENPILLKIIKSIFEKKNIKDLQIVFNEPYEERLVSAILGTAELVGKGWEKEAIPIIQSKKSIISRLFSSLFS